MKHLFRPKIILLSVIFLCAALFASVFILTRSERQRSEKLREKAEVVYPRVLQDLAIVEKEPFFEPVSGYRDAGEYLNTRLRKAHEEKDIDWEKLMSYDYWDLSSKIAVSDNPLSQEAPNSIFLFDRLKEKMSAEKDSLPKLRLLRKMAKLFYSTEQTLPTLLSVWCLKQEQEVYKNAVKNGAVRKSDWKPMSPEATDAAQRVFKAMNAYYSILSVKDTVPHPEHWCAAISEASVSASWFRPFFEGGFPFEGDYSAKLAELDHLLDPSATACRLTFARRFAEDVKQESIFHRKFPTNAVYSRKSWLFLRYGESIPYLRRMLGDYSLRSWGGGWLSAY